ncbi:hypothetical protein D3C80_1147270 [compost metagenome]
MGGVRIRRVRNIQHAEFEPFLFPVRLRRIIVIFRRCIGRSRTMPRRPIVHILPETKVVLSKLVRISCIFDERITVIAAYVSHFYVRIQVGLSLCSGKRVDSLLQRYEGSQHLCIAVRLRAPVQNLTASVTVHARLVYSMRCFACEWPSISGLYLKRSACCNQTSNQQHCSKFCNRFLFNVQVHVHVSTPLLRMMILVQIMLVINTPDGLLPRLCISPPPSGKIRLP